jgi:hypothetical protein
VLVVLYLGVGIVLTWVKLAGFYGYSCYFEKSAASESIGWPQITAYQALAKLWQPKVERCLFHCASRRELGSAAIVPFGDQYKPFKVV